MKTSQKENANSRKNAAGGLLNSQLGGTLNSSMLSLNGNPSLGLGDRRTFVKVYHGEMKYFLLNSMSSCMHLVNHIKEQLSLGKEDVIDLIDFDGVLREVPNGNNKDYAIQYLVPTGNYAVIRVETDQATNEKRYSAMLSDKGLNHNMQKTLATLNAGKPSNNRARQASKSNKQLTGSTTSLNSLTGGGGGGKEGGNSSSNAQSSSNTARRTSRQAK